MAITSERGTCMDHGSVEQFIGRWKAAGAAERANYALFLSELCDLLGLPHPDPTQPDDAANAYVFEKDVTFQHADGTASIGRIDSYRRGCFVLEAKQGVDAPDAQAAPLVKRQTKPKAGHGPGWRVPDLLDRHRQREYVVRPGGLPTVWG